MLPITSREEYEKWKAERSKKLSQLNEDEFHTRCFECGNEIVDANNFCPHCGIPLKNQNYESGGELQNEKIYRKIVSKIRNKFSPGLIYYRVKRLIRTTIICLIAYSVVSLFYGGNRSESSMKKYIMYSPMQLRSLKITVMNH